MKIKACFAAHAAYKSLTTLLAGICILLLSGMLVTSGAKTLNVFIWSQYMKPEIIKKFEDKYDVKVSLTYYNSLGQMFSKLQAGGDSQYDIVVPSNYFVPRLINAGLLQPLNKNLIPNFDNIMDRFKSPPFDPGNKYTAAYQWGTTGIAYNTKEFPDAPDSWAVLFDPKINSKYPFVMSTDSQVMLGAACAYQGNGYACKGKQKWLKAGKLILKTKKRSNFDGFMEDTRMLKALARGNLAAGVSYNGDFVFDKAHNPDEFSDIKFVVPKEGGELWLDNLAIPAHAPHPDLANKFINFILEPKIGADLSNYNYYATPNKKSVQYLIKPLKNPPVRPDEKLMKRVHYTPSLSGQELQFVQQLWSSILSK